jgi:hypothetical protein
MQLLQTTTQLIEYKERLERQQEVLALSTVFSTEERNDMLLIYCNAIAICNKRIESRKNETLQQLHNSCL